MSALERGKFARMSGYRMKSVETLGSQNLGLKSWSWNLRNVSQSDLVFRMERVAALQMVCVALLSKRGVRNGKT